MNDAEKNIKASIRNVSVAIFLMAVALVINVWLVFHRPNPKPLTVPACCATLELCCREAY